MGGNTILVGGVLIESKTIPHVTFYSDGTCQAFRAQFTRGGASSILSIDPWTCAPVLPPPDPNAPAPF
jgi:general secretion pathway protein H